MYLKFTFIVLLSAVVFKGQAQNGSRLFVNTGLSKVKFTGKLNQVFKPGIDFSSGIELVIPGNWFLQGTWDMSTMKYHQQLTDEKSNYLSQNADANLLMLGINGGKHFDLSKHLAVSTYLGGGYFTISEPRINVQNNLATQEEVRKNSAFGRLGSKVSLQTGINFLEMIYVDASWWTTPLNVQNQPLRGLAFILGAKMKM